MTIWIVREHESRYGTLRISAFTTVEKAQEYIKKRMSQVAKKLEPECKEFVDVCGRLPEECAEDLEWDDMDGNWIAVNDIHVDTGEFLEMAD